MYSIAKALVRRAVIRQAGGLRLQHGEPQLPGRLDRAGLYLHVPFCRRPCPYCAYNRWEYDAGLYATFEEAVKQEISQTARRTAIGEITSLYVGGGTPTVNTGGLLRILDHLRASFGPANQTCIELHPDWMPPETLDRLRRWGVDMVSIGAQSFHDHHLARIGRSHSAARARQAIRDAVEAGFTTVNVDLMFVLPGQAVAEVEDDVATAIGCGATQISTNPLLRFPYARLGRQAGLTRVGRPNGRQTRRMLATIDRVARAHRLRRCAVWSWIRPQGRKFSAVARHHYLGFGPSAASMTGRDLFFNTFHVGAYAEAVRRGSAVSLSMPLSRRLEMAYWLYWRLYELTVGRAPFASMFDRDLGRYYGWLFVVPRLLRLMRRTREGYEVTDRGAYWIHRLQNAYSLDYITRIWSRCRQEPWPAEVRL